MDEERTHLDGFMTGPSGGGHRALVLTVFGAAAAIFLMLQAWNLSQEPWDLDSGSATAIATEGTCDWIRGGQFVLEHDGEQHLCGGAPTQCGLPGDEGTPVAYDPTAPSHCRAAASVNGMSPYERITLMLAVSLFLGGVAGVTYFASDRVRNAALAAAEQDSGAASERFARLQRLSWAALVGTLLAINGTALVALL